MIENCPKLISKWQEKGNQAQNIHKISTKRREEQPRVSILTRGGTKIGDDVTNSRN